MLVQWGGELYKDCGEVLEEEGLGAERVEDAGCKYWALLFYRAEVGWQVKRHKTANAMGAGIHNCGYGDSGSLHVVLVDKCGSTEMIGSTSVVRIVLQQRN